jgi:nicotinamide mononucleotide transporter
MFKVDPIEFIAAFFGILSIFYSIKRRVEVYPIGLVSIISYIYICFVYGIYADMAMQVIYGVMSIQGWYIWYSVRSVDDTINSKELNLKQYIYAFVSGFLIWPVIAYILHNYSDSNVVIVDSFTTSFSIVAMWLMVYQYRQHWLLWVIVNFVSVPLYYYKGLYFSVVFYFLAFIMAIYGFVSWGRPDKHWAPMAPTHQD